MKVYLLLFIAVMGLYGCEKANNQSIAFDKQLDLDITKRAYYDEDYNRYETNQFTANKKEFNYALETKGSNEYRVLMYGIPMSNVTIELRDGNGQVVMSGEQANVGFSAKYFVFKSSAGTKYSVHISTSNAGVYGQDFYLTFEEIGTYFLSWKGIDLVCDGDWEINSNNQLIHIGHQSGFSKWAKVANKYYLDCDIQLEFDRPNAGLSSFLGLAVNAEDDIFDMLNLPDVARQFKLTSFNQWEFLWVNIGNQGGIGKKTGILSQPLVLGANALSCDIKHDSLRFAINGLPEESFFNDTYGMHRIYITADDTDTDTLKINSLVIK